MLCNTNDMNYALTKVVLQNLAMFDTYILTDSGKFLFF